MAKAKIKRNIFLGLGLFFLTVAGIGGTYAYYSDSITVENRIQLGDIDVSLVEYRIDAKGKERLYEDNLLVQPGDTISKIPRITCQAQPCYIRALITHGTSASQSELSAMECVESLSDENIFGFSDNWTKIGNYYYYLQILTPGESVDLFQGITIPGEWDNAHAKQELNLSIQIDAIQADNFVPDFSSMQPWGNEEIEICAHSGDRSTFVNPYTTMYVEFEGNSHKLIAVPQDFFTNIGTAMPGDILSDTVTLKNTTEDDVELFFHTALPDSLTEEQRSLLEQIALTISLDGKELYCGNLEAASLHSDISLGSYPSQHTGDFDFTLTIPVTLKNQYALADTIVKWVFSVRQDGFASPVRTSDTMMYLPFLFLGIGGMILLCIYFILKIYKPSECMSGSKLATTSQKGKYIFLFCLLISCTLLNTIMIHASTDTDTEDPIIGYLTQENPKTRSVNNSSIIPIYYSSYQTFWTESAIKYIKDDNLNPDSLGKWRLVYCLEHDRKAPAGNMTFTGWQNKKVSYALYYGCMYWGEPCRYAPYSTGDWALDYTATQVAIWVLTDQFSLDHAVNEIIGKCPGPATQQQRQLVAASCTKIVNDANKDYYYGGWNSGGWIDLSLSGATTFDVNGYQDTWTNSGDGYYRSGGAFTITFNSYYGYDMRNQITSMNIAIPDGVNIRKKNSSTFSDFDLYISEGQYQQWQKTGKDIPVTITITLPREWSGAIYSPSEDIYQPITFLTFRTSADTVTFTKTITLHIPQVEPEPLRTLTLHKVISQDDIWWAHGSPAFLFEITGTDTDGMTHTYTRALTYTKEYVASNTASDGSITLSTAIKNIPAGIYTVKEQNVSRFVLTDVTAQTDNIQITKQAAGSSYGDIVPITANVNADLTLSDGEITFNNRKITWDQYSHKDITINSFSLQLP